MKSRIFLFYLFTLLPLQMQAQVGDHRSDFAIGINGVVEDGVTFMMASREKALCDLILHDTYLPQQSVKGLWQYLEEDIRFDIDELATFDVSIIEACAKSGRKENILNNLIKILKR